MTLKTTIALALLVGVGPLLSAQHPESARDSAMFEHQARKIARLDSQVTALQRKIGAQRTDSGRTVVAPAPAATAPPIRISGVLQAWYAQGDGGFQNTFRIRRAELKFVGEPSRRTRWTITFDAAKLLTTSNVTTVVNGSNDVTQTSVNQSGRVLHDAFLSLTLPARIQLDLGQFKIPVGVEGGLQSSSTLETVERALFASDRGRGGIYGESRDVGLLARAPAGRTVDYALGVFNGVGEGQNDTDRNRQKAVVGRIGSKVPFIPQLSMGASGAFSTKSAPDTLVRQRAGADLRLVAGPVFLKGEFMSGRDGARRGEGWYAHVGYSPTTRVTLIVRHDVFDPDRSCETALANARERDWISGFTYDVPVMNVRFQMNYLRKYFPSVIASPRGLLLTNLQATL